MVDTLHDTIGCSVGLLAGIWADQTRRCIARCPAVERLLMQATEAGAKPAKACGKRSAEQAGECNIEATQY